MSFSQNSSQETERDSNVNKPGNLPFTKIVRLNFSRKNLSSSQAEENEEILEQLKKGAKWHTPRARTLDKMVNEGVASSPL